MGLLRSPAGDKPPCHRGLCSTLELAAHHWLFLWRAGLPRAGRQSRPNSLTTFYQIRRGEWFWVCCAAQRGTSPLATEVYAAPWNSLPTLVFLWRAGLPRAGWRSRPNSLTKSCQIHRGEWFWVCYAAQRGTSPLVTEVYAAPWTSLPTLAFLVASGLAPRWAAKPPQHPHQVLPDTSRGMVLGLLRSPAGDKPPCHRGLCSTLELAANTGFFVASGLAPRWVAKPPQ